MDELTGQPSSSGRRVAFFGGSFDPPHLGHLAVARAAQAALGLGTVLFAPVGAQPLKPLGSTAEFADRVAMTQLAISGEPGFELSLADAPKPSGEPNYTLETLLGLRAALPPGNSLFCLMGADSFALLKRWHRAAEIPFAAPMIVASRPGEKMDDLQSQLPAGLSIEAFPAADEASAEFEDTALAAEGMPTADPFSQGLKPKISNAHHLKPCPFKAQIELRRYLLRNQVGEIAPFYLLPGLQIDISASDIRDQIRRRGELQPQPEAHPPDRDLLPATVSDYIRDHRLYL
ncbi:MAG: nicotinate-nucleotide adenylyltransferase [Terracidiphilus sp.]|jgi:nicotinate-nucleotide adenylyltransferase